MITAGTMTAMEGLLRQKDGLLLENERLRAETADLRVSNQTLDRSNIELRAEIERLLKVCKDKAVLLTAAYEQKGRLEAENAKLRAFLNIAVEVYEGEHGPIKDEGKAADHWSIMAKRVLTTSKD